MLYFAYGSNLCEPRLRSRVPSARFVAVGWLGGHDLRFHKRGRDGSGKGDAHRASPENRVWGALAEIAPAEISRLDRIEGVGAGYDRAHVSVTLPDGAPVAAETYLASPAFVDASLLPFRWYLDLVVGGARARGLPRAYVDGIAAVDSVPDPDPDRELLHRERMC